MDNFTIGFTEDQVKILADYIETNLQPCIEENKDANINWICEICEIYKKLDVIRKGLELTT